MNSGIGNTSITWEVLAATVSGASSGFLTVERNVHASQKAFRVATKLDLSASPVTEAMNALQE